MAANTRDLMTRAGRAQAASEAGRPDDLMAAIAAGKISLEGDVDAESGPGRWRGKAIELADVIADELSRGALAGAAQPALRVEAARIVARLAHHFGPSTLYIFNPRHMERELRNLRIVAEYDGTIEGPNGVNALARRYRVGPSQVFGILRAARRC